MLFRSDASTCYTLKAIISSTPLKDELNAAVYGSANAVTVFPNPVSDELNVQSQSGNILSLQLFDLSGRLIKDINDINTQESRVNAADLNNGTYLLRVITESGVSSVHVDVVK